jgi:prenyltransferase beta subunit
LVSPAWAQVPTPDELHTTIAYLRSLQNEDGGFSAAKPADGKGASSLRATTAALRALKYFGGEPRDRSAAAHFVVRCFNKSVGGFADRPGGSSVDVATTSIGLLALVDLKLPEGDHTGRALKYLGEHVQGFEDIRIAAAALESVRRSPPKAAAWRKSLEQMRHEDGTFGKGDGAARATGGAMAALLRLGAPVKNRDAVLRTLRDGQRDDGGWGKPGVAGSDLETCYRVVRCLHMLHEKPNLARCQRFVARCRNSDGGYGVAPGQPSSVSATYFAGIILHWLDEK